MTDEVVLLKHGQPVKYRRCDLCGHYSRALTPRGWCESCEQEFRSIQKKQSHNGEAKP